MVALKVVILVSAISPIFSKEWKEDDEIDNGDDSPIDSQFTAGGDSSERKTTFKAEPLVDKQEYSEFESNNLPEERQREFLNSENSFALSKNKKKAKETTEPLTTIPAKPTDGTKGEPKFKFSTPEPNKNSFPAIASKAEKPEQLTDEHGHSLENLEKMLKNVRPEKETIKSDGPVLVVEKPTGQLTSVGSGLDIEKIKYVGPVYIWKPGSDRDQDTIAEDEDELKNEVNLSMPVSDNWKNLLAEAWKAMHAEKHHVQLPMSTVAMPEAKMYPIPAGTTSPNTTDVHKRERVDGVTIGLVIAISVIVFLIIIVNCFTLRIYLKETKDHRTFQYTQSIGYRQYGGRSPHIIDLSDDSIWDANCSSIEFKSLR